MPPAPLPVILDVDTGVDDACALLLAARHPALDLRAVTCVAGNAPLDLVVANTLTVLDVAGRQEVPVAAGAGRPLLEDPVDARHVHGRDGMGDLGRPRSARVPQPVHAVELLRSQLMAAARTGEPITLIPLAPLTNIALLLRTYPAVAQGISRVLFMGGSASTGNATASAEFNVFHDPEAAAIVLDACAALGVPVTMYGLDVFYEPQVTAAQAGELIAADPAGPAGLAGELIAYQCARFESQSATIGDAGAVCAAIAPEGIVTRTLPVRVELSGRHTRGRTVVDQRDPLTHDPHGRPDAVVDVAVDVDGAAFSRLWLDTVGFHTVGGGR